MWTDKPSSLSRNAFDDQNMNSAFNFPLRHQLVKVIATHDHADAADACGQPASSLARAYEMMKGYPKTAMPNGFVSNHDFVRLGDLIQRAGYGKDGEKNSAYFARHKAAYSFLAAGSGPLTMYYNDEIGEELKGFVNQPDNCGEVCRCDDHVGRTDGRFDNLTVYSDDRLFIDLKSYDGENILYILNVSEGGADLTLKPDFWQKLVGGASSLTDLVTGRTIAPESVKVEGLSGIFLKVNR